MDRRIMGTMGEPLKATKLLVKKCSFDHSDTEVRAYIVVNENAKTFTSMNTYTKDGVTFVGDRFDPTKMTHPISDKSAAKWAAKGYVETDEFPAQVTKVEIDSLAPVAA